MLAIGRPHQFRPQLWCQVLVLVLPESNEVMEDVSMPYGHPKQHHASCLSIMFGQSITTCAVGCAKTDARAQMLASVVVLAILLWTQCTGGQSAVPG